MHHASEPLGRKAGDTVYLHDESDDEANVSQYADQILMFVR